MALITASQVINNLPIHQGLDEAFVTPIIEAVQLQQLSPVMSSGYYDDVVASGWMNDGTINISGYNATTSGVLNTLLASGVKPFLYWSIGVSALEEIAYQVGNAGIVNFNPQQGQSEDKAIQRRIMQWQGYKNTYENWIKQYIIDRADQSGFEGYANGGVSISGGNSSFNLLGMV